MTPSPFSHAIYRLKSRFPTHMSEYSLDPHQTDLIRFWTPNLPPEDAHGRRHSGSTEGTQRNYGERG